MKKLILAALVVLPGLAACTETEDKPSGLRARQDAALKDPWKYSPYDEDPTDISGGGLMEFNKRAFKRDLDSVFNP